MAKFTDKKNNAAAKNGVAPKIAGPAGVAKKNKKQPAVAPAAAKPTAAVKAAIVADAKPKKVVQPREKIVKTGHTVFIGNLPAKIKRKQIVQLLKPFGTTGSIRFRRSNGGKIFKADLATAQNIIGFADLATAAEAAAAVKGLNGTKFGGHVLRVDLQQEKGASGKKPATKSAKPAAKQATAKAVKQETAEEEDAEFDDDSENDSEAEAPAPKKAPVAQKAPAAKNNKKKGGKKASA